MGAGASVAQKHNARDHSNHVSAHTTRSANSVRAMALKNHARQENSYIPQDRLRSKFNKTVRHANNAEFVDGAHAHTPASTATCGKDDGKATNEPSPSPSPLPVGATTVTGSLVQFKNAMNLNLKIQLEDDNDWGKVCLLFFILICVYA